MTPTPKDKELTPKEAAELKKHAALAKTKDRFFAFSKGKEDHSLILSDRKIPGDVAKRGCARVEGTAIVNGVCFTEEGTLVFETQTPPPAGMADWLKKALKEVGLTPKVLVRKADKERQVAPDDDHDGKSDDKQDGKPAPKFSMVALQKSRLAWDAARKRVHADIGKLQEAIQKTMPEEAEVAEALDDVLEEFNQDLLDVLDDALNAPENERVTHHKKAVELIVKYRQLVASSAAIKHVDKNPFVKLAIEKDLSTTLQNMATQLGA